jgi:hypothetical protein
MKALLDDGGMALTQAAEVKLLAMSLCPADGLLRNSEWKGTGERMGHKRIQ